MIALRSVIRAILAFFAFCLLTGYALSFIEVYCFHYYDPKFGSPSSALRMTLLVSTLYTVSSAAAFVVAIGLMYRLLPRLTMRQLTIASAASAVLSVLVLFSEVPETVAAQLTRNDSAIIALIAFGPSLAGTLLVFLLAILLQRLGYVGEHVA